MITENTSLSGIFAGSWENLYLQFIKLNPSYKDKDKVKNLAKLYIKFGKIFAIRSDLAWAQMEHETGCLEYKGIAKPEWNNFAGIGVTGSPGVGNRFDTEELGVIAHFAHLAWYIYPSHVCEYCNKTYDPRHFGLKHNFNGSDLLVTLNGRWAVPGKTYAQAIAKLANFIIAFPEIDKYDLIIQMGHVGRTSGATGTAGEQAFTKALGAALYKKFTDNTTVKVRLMGADNWTAPQPNKTMLFFAIHADGSINKNARGISVGYPEGANQVFSYHIKNNYRLLTGFSSRQDNYTKGLKNYYAWRLNHVKADHYCLLEHGFMTNPIERDYMNNHTREIADCHFETIIEFLKENY
jgi:N-acetylmuramoyl-L-alanine amidase